MPCACVYIYICRSVHIHLHIHIYIHTIYMHMYTSWSLPTVAWMMHNILTILMLGPLGEVEHFRVGHRLPLAAGATRGLPILSRLGFLGQCSCGVDCNGHNTYQYHGPILPAKLCITSYTSNIPHSDSSYFLGLSIRLLHRELRGILPKAADALRTKAGTKAVHTAGVFYVEVCATFRCQAILG